MYGTLNYGNSLDNPLRQEPAAWYSMSLKPWVGILA